MTALAMFSTLAAAQAAPSAGAMVILTGYYEAGDGPPAFYKPVPSHG